MLEIASSSLTSHTDVGNCLMIAISGVKRWQFVCLPGRVGGCLMMFTTGLLDMQCQGRCFKQVNIDDGDWMRGYCS
jgi:hypothetical protein